MVRVTLEFDIDESTFRAVLGGDAPAEAMRGITVERVAAQLVGEHEPDDGYIRWRIRQTSKDDDPID